MIPQPVGTTSTLTATANQNCYRVAIGIKTPSGSQTWYEFTNTSSISKAITFNQTGLYTITVSARDISDEYAGSVAVSHVYTIRIY